MLVVKALTDTGYEFAHNDGFALLHSGEVIVDVLGCYTVTLCVCGIVVLLGTVEQGFGGDTAYIKARAAEGRLLKEDDILSGFGSQFCCGVACGATAYDGEKIFHVDNFFE